MFIGNIIKLKNIRLYAEAPQMYSFIYQNNNN